MAFEWVAGLFQSDNQQTRGLSGDLGGTVALDNANPYYNYRLRRHKAEGDLVDDPGLLWYTSPYVKQRTGFGTHVGAEVGDGTANYTDVLLILSAEDHARVSDAWKEDAIRTLQQEFETFCRREGFKRLHPHRPLQFRILADGSEDLHGAKLNLGAGEFVTGLLPNLYTGPVRGSRPVIGVHLNLPGVWEGYREVGRLFNDQMLFTLGNHWLDNFSHESLEQAALYRLRQYPDGSFVHIINPDLQDRYQVTSANQGGASVLTLATREGTPLAFVVLAVIDEEAAKPAAPQPALETSDGRVPSIAPPMMVDDDDEETVEAGLNKTIIPDAPNERIFTLQERGALLQRVHFSAFMLGYDVYLGRRGELGTHVDEVAATFQVRKRSVSLVAHIDGVVVGGRPVPPDVEVPIEGDMQIQVSGERLQYRDLRGLRADGWPYVGEIRRPASSTYMIWGEDYQIGRSRECRVVLPDEPRNQNIHWKPSVGDGATIRARTGEIPKSRFYTDSIMVASEHSTLDLRQEHPRVICNARHCYVYIRRDDDVKPLYPSTSGREPQQMDLQPGDEVLIGNCLFHVGFTPAGEAAAVAEAPLIDMSSLQAPELPEAPPPELADAVEEPDFAALDDSPAPTQDRVEGPPEIAAPMMIDEDEDGVPDAPPPLTPDVSISDAPPLPDLMGTPPMPPPPPLDAPPPPPSEEPAVDDAVPPPPPADSAPPPPPLDSVPPPPPEDSAPPPPPTDSVPPPPPEESVPPPPPEESVPPPPPTDSVPPPPPEEDEPTVTASELNLPPDVGTWDNDSWDEPADQVETVVEEPSGAALTYPPPEDDEKNDAWAVTSFDADPDEEETFNQAISVFDLHGSSDLNPDPPTSETDDLESIAVELGGAASQADEEEAVEEEAEEADPVEEEAEPVEEEAEEADPVEEEAEPVEEEAEEADPVEEEAEPVEEEADEAEPVEEEADPVEEDEPVEEEGEPVEDEPEVVFTDDSEAQFELGRPMHLVLCGWALNGEATVGNHVEAELVVPENRIEPGQSFSACDYFTLKVRGRRGKLTIHSPGEVLVDDEEPTTEVIDDPEKHTYDIIRRDDEGEEDFLVRLTLGADKSLPDPRARLLGFDNTDPLAAALVTRGLPKGQDRKLVVDGISLTLHFDGEQVTIRDYLSTYRLDDGGFVPFFVAVAGERFRTAPEDGTDIVLHAGDRLVIGNCVYALRAE